MWKQQEVMDGVCILTAFAPPPPFLPPEPYLLGELVGLGIGTEVCCASYAASVFWLQSRTVSTETNGKRQSLPCAL